MKCWAAFPKCSRSNFIVAKPHNELPGGTWHRQHVFAFAFGPCANLFRPLRFLIELCSRPEEQDSQDILIRALEPDVPEPSTVVAPSKAHHTSAALTPSRNGGPLFDRRFDLIKFASNCHAQLTSPS